MKKERVKDLRPYETALCAGREANINELIEQFMKDPALHHICVVDNKDRLLGLVNRKRLFKVLFLHHLSPDTRLSKLLGLVTAETSSDLMLTHVISCREDEGIRELIKKIIVNRIRELPVVDDEGRVLGFVTIPMLLKKWMEGEV
ncbi:MAG: CBS domain-containing protein [Nitrospirae bacterium]|nr:MAG: CBS domain-containing protein [Nitrospirota bacterium]